MSRTVADVRHVFGLIGGARWCRAGEGQGGVLSRQRWRASIRWVRWRRTISFARHQFPPAVIRHAVWLYMRFTLSYRDVEDLLAERGLDISHNGAALGIEVRAVVRPRTSASTPA